MKAGFQAHLSYHICRCALAEVLEYAYRTSISASTDHRDCAVAGMGVVALQACKTQTVIKGRYRQTAGSNGLANTEVDHGFFSPTADPNYLISP